MAEFDHNDEDFKWGRMAKTSYQGNVAYLSFFFKGEEYLLFDNVLIFDEYEPQNHVGKMMALWEDKETGKKMVRIRWFLRPKELPSFNLDKNSKELFLAFGKGKGVTNENDLSVVIRKVTVLCTSKNPQNKQASEEALKNAEHYYCKVYNVDLKRLSDVDAVANKLGRQVVYNKASWLSGLAAKALPVVAAARDAESKQTVQNHDADLGTASKANGNAEANNFEDAKLKNEPPIAPSVDPKKRLLPCSEVEKEIEREKQDAETEKEVTKRQRVSENEVSDSSKQEKDREGVSALKKSPPLKLQNKSDLIVDLSGKNDEVMPDSVELQNSNDKLKLKSEDIEIDRTAISVKSSPSPIVDGATGTLPKESILKETLPDTSSAEPKVGRDSGKDLANDSTKVLLKSPKGEVSINVISPPKGLNSEHSIKTKPQEQKNDSNIFSESLEAENKSPDSALKKVTFSKDTKVEPAEKSTFGKITIVGGKEPNSTLTDEQSIDLKNNLNVLPKSVSNSEKRSIFRQLPWEESLEQALPQARVIIVRNIDLSLTSKEVCDMVKNVFKGVSDARVLPQESLQVSLTGEALVIFNNKTDADFAVQELEEKCLVIDGKRPLIGSLIKPPKTSKVDFPGHVRLEKFKLSRHFQNEDMRKAVSTSHCSQPNTMEFEMAMEWRLLQDRVQRCWTNFYKMQKSDIMELLNKFKKKG